MKIKTDFVTNSSSTSYVVFVPKNFTYEEKDLIKYLEESYDDTYEDDEIPNLKDDINDIISHLDRGGQVWSDDYHYAAYDFLLNKLLEENLVLGSIDSGPDSNVMAGTDKKIIESAFMAINKDKITNICKTGEIK